MENKNGILLIDKPSGMSSHDVVNHIRRKLDIRRVGHTGTLDPAATGLLVMLIGRGTLLSSWLVGMTKRYIARVVFGVSTDTYDEAGEIVSRSDPGVFDRDKLDGLLAGYRGEIEQIIPPYSAAKRNGMTYHKLARRGRDFSPGVKAVEIISLDVTEYAWPEIVFDIRCSSGTYIRSLAHQLGLDLGCGGHLRVLRRLEVGPFNLSEGETLEQIMKSANPLKFIRPLKSAFPGASALYVKDEFREEVLLGRPLQLRYFDEYRYTGQGDEMALLLDTSDNILALVRLNAKWNTKDQLDPFQKMGSYMRVIDEADIRVG